MRIYNEQGYFMIEPVIKTKLPFCFICGGRATGKTYSSLRYMPEHNIKFILLRRTQAQVDLISKQEYSPFTPIAEDMGINIVSVPLSKYNTGFYRAEVSEEGKLSPVGPCLGYCMALSTISNLRGFSAEDVKIMIFDEFIPERHERPIKAEAAAFFNAYETINRNRELKGEDPLQVLCLANSNDAGNPIWTEMKLISKVEQMKKKGQIYSLDYDRGVGIWLLDSSPISQQKKATALYRATAGTEFEEMALMNEFQEFKTDLVKPMPIKEYVPICRVGEITIYKHKSNNTYYCTEMYLGDPPEYGADENDLKRWFRKFGYLYTAYMRNNIYFEDATSEIIFNKYCA